MRRARISAYFITNRVDQIYLTGFDGEDGACLITARDVHIMTDGRFEVAFAQQAPWATRHNRRNGLVTTAAQCIKRCRVRTVAFQADQMSVELLNSMRRAVRPVRLVPAPPLVNGLRLIKDRAELKHIREAVRIAELAFKAARRQLKAGMTEIQLAAILEFEMRRAGALGPSFPTIVATGSNAALPHAHPGKRVIRRGSAVLIDWGAVSGHYCSDLTRMVYLGTIPPRLKRVHQIVLEAQVAAIEAVRPGVRMCDIDSIAREHITAAGYADAFNHGLGHGLGLDIHEAPRVRPGIQDLLEPGMVITIEPGIYLPGIGGVRIEDDVLVTSSGHEVLTKLNKSLKTAVK